MPDHADARRYLEAAQAQLDAVNKIPEKDNFPIGTVLKWTKRTGEEKVAIKYQNRQQKDAENWMMVMYARPLTWSYLITQMGIIESIETPTGWADLTVKPEPKAEKVVLDIGLTTGHMIDPRDIVLRYRGTDYAWDWDQEIWEPVE